jgi:hypothetical protein
MYKASVNVGINQYEPGMELHGCVNDALGWSDLANTVGYSTTRLLDGDATKANIIEAWTATLSSMRRGDRFLETYSGHGSQIPDMSGDEPDGADEVIVPVDYGRGGMASVISDDEKQALFAPFRKKGIRITSVSDSCNSGSVNRYLQPFRSRPYASGGKADALREFYLKTTHKPRFMPSSYFLDGEPLRRMGILERRELSEQTPRTSAGTVLFSGCRDDQYSWDAFIEGKQQGAFSWAALAAYQSLTFAGQWRRWDPTYWRWHKKTRELLLGSEYDQEPLMYASLWQRTWRL